MTDLTLYLRNGETKLFNALSEDLKKEWKVLDEKLQYEDSAEKQYMRFSLIHVSDPILITFRERAAKASSSEEMRQLIEETDFSQVNPRDTLEILYALGPNVLSELIQSLLQEAKERRDLEHIALLTDVRNAFLIASSRVAV